MRIATLEMICVGFRISGRSESGIIRGEVCLCWSQLERRSAQAKASLHQLAPDRSPLFLGVAPYCRRRGVLDLDPLPGAAGAICTLVHA
jgi:hypothetical protein